MCVTSSEFKLVVAENERCSRHAVNYTLAITEHIVHYCTGQIERPMQKGSLHIRRGRHANFLECSVHISVIIQFENEYY